ncbi:MAG: response regulator [Bacteroidales bacterium]|nr:response regulator [Bacteroidales bacterium]
MLGRKSKTKIAEAVDVSEIKQLKETILKLERELAELRIAENTRASEDFRDIFNTVTDGLAYTSLTGKVISVNDALLEILGLKREEIEKKGILDLAAGLLDEKQNSIARPLLELIIKGKNVEPFVVRYRNKYLEVSGRLNLNSRRITGTIRDITDKVKADEALRNSEMRLRRAELVSGTGNWELNLRTGMIYGSEGAVKLYGLSNELLRYEDIKDIPLPEYRSLLDEELRNLINGLKPYNIEFKIRNQATGKILDIHSVAEFDPDEKIVFGIIQDITYRKKIEGELKKRNDELNQLLNISLGLFESLDKKTILNKIIKGALDLINCNAGAIYTLSGDRLYLEATFPPVPDDYPEIFRVADINEHLHIRKAIETGKPVIAEDIASEQLTAQEKIIVDRMDIKSLIYFPLSSPGILRGVLNLGTTGVYHKFTPIEISLGQTLSNISSLSLENALLVERLTNEKNKAEESDRLKTAFLQNISHEIRTPLNAIVGFSSFLGNRSLDDEERKNYMDVIIQSNNQLLSIVEDVLNISQIETGQVSLREAFVSPCKIIESLYNQYKPEADRKGLEFILKKENELLCNEAILVDETKLYQVINNLLSNAFKFTWSGFVMLRCIREDGFLKIEVSDSGIGIPESEHSKIFERFYQVDKSATRKYGGTGLGLAISKAWVRLMNGEISLFSEPGKGSKFVISIPVKDSKPADYASPSEPETGKIKKMKSVKIIVAEDEESNYLLLEALLSNHGFSILHARNGQEAVELYTKNRDVRIILMDIKMPVMDGLTATRRIHDINPQVPVIAQTAYAFPEDREKAIEAGCNEYISKPFSREKLNSVLRKYIMVF